MIKLVAFDIDNTIALHNKPATKEVIELLQELTDEGIRIMLISGKPAIYISGMVRQLGMEDIIVSGENGAVIYYSNSVPPKEEILTDIKKYKIKTLAGMKMTLMKEYGSGIWLQPNNINITCFPKDETVRQKLYEYVDRLEESEDFHKNFTVYRSNICIEIVPSEISKGNALKKVMELEGIDKEETIAVGDSPNDFPMFEQCGISMGINIKGRYPVDCSFNNVTDAIKLILEMVRKEADGIASGE